MSKRLGQPDEIEKVASEIRAREFPRLLNFTDIVNRFVAIHLEEKSDWLRNSALSFLITSGGSLTPTELARLMLRSKHYMTKLIDSFEKDGFAVRERASKDRRTIQVRITPAGLDYIMKTLITNDWMEREVMACLDDSEIETLRNLVQRLRKKMFETVSERAPANNASLASRRRIIV